MKKIRLFTLLQLIWISLVLGGCSMTHNSTTVSPGRTDSITITIKSGNPQNDKLILDPAGTVDVYPGTVVTWVVDPSSNVKFFLIQKNSLSRNIFNSRFTPPTNYTPRGSGTINASSVVGKVFSYTIYWTKNPSDYRIHRYDPKLAVKSNGMTSKPDLNYIGCGLLFLLPLSVFRIKKEPAQS